MDAGSNALADSRPRRKGGESDRRSEEAKVMAVNSERHLNAIGNRARVDGPRNVVTLMQRDNKIPPAADRSRGISRFQNDSVSGKFRACFERPTDSKRPRPPFARVFMYRVSPKSER